MFDGELNVFDFNNTIAGTYFQVVIDKTSLVDGYALFRMFPEGSVGGFTLSDGPSTSDALANSSAWVINRAPLSSAMDVR
jgi:hypothetical protein